MESMSLALITALQLLPPRQRAAIVLRDVLGFHAREAADILDTTEESVTSALKRARAALERHQQSSPRREPAPPPGSAAEQRLVDRLSRARLRLLRPRPADRRLLYRRTDGLDPLRHTHLGHDPL